MYVIYEKSVHTIFTGGKEMANSYKPSFIPLRLCMCAFALSSSGGPWIATIFIEIQNPNGYFILLAVVVVCVWFSFVATIFAFDLLRL